MELAKDLIIRQPINKYSKTLTQPKNGHKRAILYARVSTDEQHEKGTSIDTQLRVCREYAEKNDMQVVLEAVDDFTGTVIDRPEMKNVLSWLDEGKADTLVVMTMDRLARKSWVFAVLFEQFNQWGKELHFTDSGMVTGSFEDLLLNNFKSLMAQGERDKIVARMMGGKYERLNQNIPIMSIPAYGYRKVAKNTVVINEEEAAVVQMMFNWMAYGHDNGDPVSTVGITRELNRRGIPFSSAIRNNKKGQEWSQRVVYRLLRNPIYAGVYYYGKTKRYGHGETRHHTPKDEWIRVDVPELTIVDIDTWNIAQQRVTENVTKAKRSKKNQYLLSGHFKCGHCGKAMIGSPEKSNRRYRCASKNYASIGLQKCTYSYRSVVAYKVENKVIEWLKIFFSDEEEFEKRLEEVYQKNQNNIEPKKQQLSVTQSAINTLERKVSNLVASMADIDAGQLTSVRKEMVVLVERQIAEFLKQKTELQEEAALLTKEITETRLDKVKLTNAKEAIKDVSDRLAVPTYENLRIILDLFNVQVTFHINPQNLRERWIKITCTIMLDDRWIKLDQKDGDQSPSGGNGKKAIYGGLDNNMSYQDLHIDGGLDKTYYNKALVIQAVISLNSPASSQGSGGDAISYAGSISSVSFNDTFVDA